MFTSAQTVQVGDFRINADPYAGGVHYFDPGFEGLATRAVIGAPVHLPSLLSGTTQNPATGGTGDSGTDAGIRTLFDKTEFRNLNRFGADPDGPNPPGTAGGPQRLGALQYEIDLTPVEDYLTTTGETLTTLELRLVFTMSDVTKTYDIYLSYTEAGEGITETSISSDDAEANYADFWWPSQAGIVGDVINGTHKIENLAQTGNLDQTTDLLALYTAGVRKVNVIVAVPSFYSGRVLTVEGLSGISVGTNVLAMEQVGDLRLGEKTYPSYYYADQFGPIETQPIPFATLDVPSLLTVTSQNQGGNPDPSVAAARFNLDGVGGGTNTFNGNTATVTGFGVNGIGATASDQFQYTAWRQEGDFTVDVKLTSLTSLEAGARAGLMVRGSRNLDAAHAFVGIQQSGEPVVVSRDVAGNVASEALGGAVALPQWLRITRAGDLFSFFVSVDGVTYTAAPTASATVVLTDPVYLGLAVTSGSGANDAVAVFDELSETLADTNGDIGLQTYSSSTLIKNMSRFASSTNAGVAQWSIDLSPLDAYLATNSLNLDALRLDLLADMNDEAREFDLYLSYTDPAEPISLVGINRDNAALNYCDLFDPADGAFVGDIVNGTHKVLIANTPGDMDITEDLLALYNAGVRDLNLIIASSAFYSGDNVSILDGSGLFIETSGSPNVVITNVTRVGNVLSVTVDGLTNGSSYHLGGSDDLSGFPSISGTTVVATGSGDVLSATIPDAAHYVRVLEGAAP